MKPQTLHEITRQCQKEVKRLKEEGDEIYIQLGVVELIVIVSQLQLALRHPQNNAGDAIFAHYIAEKITDVIDHSMSPLIADALRMGFDAQYDILLVEEGEEE